MSETARYNNPNYLAAIDRVRELGIMTSYAEHAEDAVLRRGLAWSQTGFYVDVGAGDPDIDSVTRHFYQHGWRGINIEPQPALHEKLMKRRPEDVNLQLAIAREVGNIALVTYPQRWGWASTTAAVQSAHGQLNLESEEIKIDALPLRVVLNEFVPEATRIDVLKIDVEGAERIVLETADLACWRPKIIVIEATKPGSAQPCHDQWQDLLFAAGYQHAHFNGINSFYTVDPDMYNRLCVPANPFDRYTVSVPDEPFHT